MNDLTMFCWMFFGIWSLVGVIFVAVALILRRARRRKAERCTMSATGVVVELRHRRGRNGSAYYPVGELEAAGKPVRLYSNYGSSPARYAQGQRVLVYYDADNPACFYIDGDRTAHILETVFLFVGMGCVLIGSLVACLVSRAG